MHSFCMFVINKINRKRKHVDQRELLDLRRVVITLAPTILLAIKKLRKTR